MSHLLSLTRVARMVGLPRAELQRLAQEGSLLSFDGKVELAEVLRVFPGVKLDDDTEIRRLEEIKDAAVSKSVSKQELPDSEVLAERLQQLGRDYGAAKALLRHHELVHSWVDDKLREAVEQGAITAAGAESFSIWFRREIATPPGDLRRWEKLLGEERIMRVMSAQVTIMPKGHTFEVLGNETLLEAGLRAGANLPYGCSNGNCGECKARIVRGEVAKVRPHDFVLSQFDKAQGVTLLCAYTAIGDVALEASVTGARDIPEQRIKARVRMLEQLAPDVTAVHLVTPRSERMRFLAGQRVRMLVDGAEAELPVASCPCEERRIELHVHGKPEDEFVRHVRERLKPNDEVGLIGPFGEFVLDDESDRSVLLLASGQGYAPIRSLLQHALSLEHAPAITLYRLPGASGYYQENLVRSYASAIDYFHYVPLPRNAGAGDIVKTVIGDHPDLGRHDVYVAGAAAFVAAAKRALTEAGLPAERCKTEVVD